MMRKYLPILFAMLLPVQAIAADITSTADCLWTAVATGCTFSAGAAAATDNITINHNITVSGTVTMTTGSITVATGGRLIIAPGVTLTYGDGTVAGGTSAGVGLVIADGGELIQEGALLRTCRLTSQVDWSASVAATHTAVAITDCDLTNVSTTTDYIFFGDEDPADLNATLTGKCVFYGPGLAPPGCYRPAYNKWASYKVVGASGRALTWDLDPMAGNYTASPNAPYQGSRYAPAATGIAGSALTYTSRWLRRRTAVTIPIAGAFLGLASITDADRGSEYLAFQEVVASANDPTVCSGLHAKILSSTNGGVGDDFLEVEGDVSDCTSASAIAEITPGARRGDLVYVYRPATLNGNTTGAATTVGEGSIANTGGFWYARWARITNPWAADAADWSPNAGRAGNIQFIQGTATSQPTADWNWVDMAYGAYTAGTDSGFLHFVSAAGSTDLRYPNNGMLNMTGSKFRHIHIHDWLNNAVGGGGHGVYVDTAMGVDLAQIRIERINDDCFGAQLVRSDGTAIENSSITLRQALIYECIAETSNSQQGIELQTENVSNATFNPALHSGILIQDALVAGHALNVIDNATANSVYRGITTGGTNSAAGLGGTNVRTVGMRIDGTANQSGFIDTTIGFGAANANRVYDSNLYALGGTTSVAPVAVMGELNGTFVGGYDQLATTAANLGQVGMTDGSVVDLDDNLNGSGYFIAGGGARPFDFKTSSFVNSVFRSTSATAAGALANSLVLNSDSGFNHTIRRLALLMTSPNPSATGIFVNLASGGTITNSTTTIDGLFVTSNQATPSTFIAETGAGVSVVVNAACMEGTGVAATQFGGEGPSVHRLIVNPLPPASSDAVLLRDLIAPAGTRGCREENLPTYLGYKNFRVGHAMLGDFEIRNYERSSSNKALISTVGGGVANVCTGRWPCD